MNTNWLKQAGLLLAVFSLLLGPLSVTPAYALAIPVLIAPADNATTTVVDTPPLGIPEFSWAPVSGATSYRLQVSSDIAFTTKIVDITTPNTSYTPLLVTGFSDGTWYWHVRAEAPAPIGEYTNPRSFTKQWATAENSPALISPDDFATLDFYDQPVFSWDPVTGAAKYKLQIYASPGGWSTLTYSATTLAPTHQPNIKLANGTYYWRVVPVDFGIHDGTPSAERTFIAGYYSPLPTDNPALRLLEPLDNATPTFTPTFSWTAVRGAQFYRLQYSTDPSFPSSALTTTFDTRNTAYTPIVALPNDVNYYWRVRVHSGNSISDWTPSRTFIKKWYIKPTLLTPVNNYQHVRFPVFSWAPVPGAAKYFVELDTEPGFSAPIFDTGYTSNTFYSPSKYVGELTTYYWRVTPYDGNGNKGKESDTASYGSYYSSLVPHQVYPLFYYPPDTYSGFPGVTTNPHEDRTVPLPIFIWHRVYVPALAANEGQIYAEAYRLQVSTDPIFGSVNWTVDTQNTTAAPTASNPFTPLLDTDYFWRVRPLIGGSEVAEWSQIWKTRINPSPVLFPRLTSTTGSAPELIRPTTGAEFAEATPMLEWMPLSGAASYDVEISSDQNFGSTVDTATVSYPAYAPTKGLAQRSLGALDFGIYYWRVRQSPGGAWSETRRFQIAAQSQWRYSGGSFLGDAGNQLQIGSDPAADVADSDYDLSSLQVRQSNSHWYFGFPVPAAPAKNITYALYLDLDHKDASGATSDACGHDSVCLSTYSMTTIPGYQPEYAIYILQEGGAFAANKVYLYGWNGVGWNTVKVMSDWGGNLNKTGNYVEIELPNTAIGYQDTTGSYAISLLSLPADSGLPQDSVPSDPNIPGSGPISRFSSVTERMNLLSPLDDAGVDPTTYPSVLPFFWDWPILAPWSGAIMQNHLDPAFTSKQAEYILAADTAYFGQTSHAWERDIVGDNTYYWRIQPRYRVGGTLYLGAWSQGWRFERQGFVPQNLATSVTFATPTFSWDMVEGAEYYDLQVDDDPAFGSTAISISTRQNSYTGLGTLANATYYWRVRVHRWSNASAVINNWTAAQSFTLALPQPTDLSPASGTVVARAPTLCWTPLISNSLADIPVLAAWKYRVQVSKDPLFSTSSIFDNIDTEQSCWTPIKGYDDGQYYWRVAIFDGEAKLGNYSLANTFTKQYPITTLVSPISGASTGSTPTFVWTPVNGAARYKFESSQFATYSPTYDSVTTDNTRYTPTKAYASKMKYYWRVAIVDNEGKIGPFVDATIILTDPTLTFKSAGALDGWILEKSETANTGGTMNSAATTFYLGDAAADKQYRAILSFNTKTLPDTAVITKVTLKIKRPATGFLAGNNDPFKWGLGLKVDVCKNFFSTKSALQLGDFNYNNATNCKLVAGAFGATPTESWHSANILSTAFAKINKTGLTQFRLRFMKDDNDDRLADYLKFYSGNAGADGPQLIIEYHVP